MGTYKLSSSEIADSLEDSEENGDFEGDFSEKDFIAGAKLFIKRLRKRGACIPK